MKKVHILIITSILLPIILIISICAYYCISYNKRIHENRGGPSETLEADYPRNVQKWIKRRERHERENDLGSPTDMDDSTSVSTNPMSHSPRLIQKISNLEKPVNIDDKQDSSSIPRDETKMALGKQVNVNINLKTSQQNFERQDNFLSCNKNE